MKRGILFLVLLVGTSVVAQNETDAQGRKQGKWVKYHEGTKKVRYQGQFKDDKPFGEFVYYSDEGAVTAVSNFDPDGVTTRTKMYHASGNIMAMGKYVNQKRDSTWWTFNDHKEVVSQENYKNGKLDGETIVYYPANPRDQEVKKMEISIYKEGLRNGPWKQFYESGKLKADGVYKDGGYTGRVRWYRTNGQVEIEGYYKHAVKNGHWRYYNLDGDVEKDRYFKNGKELKGAALEAYLESIKPKPKN